MESVRIGKLREIGFREMKRLSTFVLAGGRGERLYPLTRDRAKPAVAFGGIYRIIDFTLSNCINSGIRRVNVLTQYKSISLARHIKLGWNFLPPDLDQYIDVLPAQQRYAESWYRGTADAIYQNIYTMVREASDHVLILAGDHIYKMDYSKMLSSHLESGAEVTVGVVEMPVEVSSQFGVVQVNEKGRIVNFEEKPEQGVTIPGKANSIFASMGIYLFDKQALLSELIPAVEEKGQFDFGRDIIPEILQRRRVHAYEFEDENRRESKYWRDVGTLDAYYEANIDLVSVDPQFNLYDEHWPVRTLQPQFPPVKTVFAQEGGSARRGEALDSLISNGVIISGGRVRNSVLSPRVRINSYSQVESSVLLKGVNVGRYCRIRNAIIDKNVQILPETVIGHDPDQDRKRFMVTESGVVVIPCNRVIGPKEDSPLWVDPVMQGQSR